MTAVPEMPFVVHPSGCSDSAPLARPLLRYFGAKWRMASWIIRQFPDHQCYVEPFGGAASVLLRKRPSPFEVYNDLDGDVVNFFRVLRTQPRELLRALKWTPYAREEFLTAYSDERSTLNPQLSTDLERARRFFVMAWQGYGGPRRKMLTGWKVQRRKWESGRADQIGEWNTAKLIVPGARRFLQVQIESDDALNVIRRFDTPNTLFYVDPPYPVGTRSRKWCRTAYTHELEEHYHTHLANLLKKIKGMAIVSSYPNFAYDDFFTAGSLAPSQKWKRIEKTVQTMNKSSATEVLFISPACASRPNWLRSLSTLNSQLSTQ